MQTLRRRVWSNPAALRTATTAVDVVYGIRRLTRGRQAKAASLSVGGAPDLERLARYRRDYGALEGSFMDGAIVTWDVLLSHQAATAVTGDLLEIGVLRGKSATMMALHARVGEALVLVDPALRREAIDAVEEAHPGGNVLIRALSQTIRDHPAVRDGAGRFRWIHVDGEHSARAVRNDLEIAAFLLGPGGIVSLDDFFRPSYPQITMAAFEFLAGHGREFQLVLTGYNKGYICCTADAPALLRFLCHSGAEEFARRAPPDVTLCKTTDPDDMNCFGVTPRYRGLVYKGPDWAPDRITV